MKDEDQLCRFVDLIFGNPFHTPTDDEDGMALAYVAALRSSDLSRQVGAAIVSPTGEVLATGRNEVPALGGGQYSPPSAEIPTARDCDVGVDSNTKERLEDALDGSPKKMMTEKLAQVRQLVSGVLPKTSLRDITEYGRAVHAEMSALVSTARAGASVRGATLFCTTFPCHTCAKHLAAAGIARVVFVEPYPKSKARDLHADAVTLVGESADPNRRSELTDNLRARRTRFEPFLGVGPRRYFDLFSMKLGTGRSNCPQGRFRKRAGVRSRNGEPARAACNHDLLGGRDRGGGSPRGREERAEREAPAMTKTTPFWQSVRELAAMRDHIPEERREMSGVRDAVRLDVRAEDGNSSSDNDAPQIARRH